MPSCLASVAPSERRNSASNTKHQPRSDNLDASTRYDRVHCHLSPSICRVRCATTHWQDSLHHHLSPTSAGSVTSTQQPAAEHRRLIFVFGSPMSHVAALADRDHEVLKGSFSTQGDPRSPELIWGHRGCIGCGSHLHWALPLRWEFSSSPGSCPSGPHTEPC